MTRENSFCLYRLKYQTALEICLLSCIWTISPTVEGWAQDHAGDKQALVALYNATDGANWENNENWLSDKPLADWYGVTVINGRVTRLNLESNLLRGPIPPDLGNLSSLKVLLLEVNRLTGPIPRELGQLSSLGELDLFWNLLTGTIPPELGNLASLRDLYLSSNQLTGPIPPELGQLSGLKGLKVSGNGLTGPIPPEIGQLFSLEWLSLSSNQLTGQIPPAIGQLSSLEVLLLGVNRLTGPIPPELGQLSSLESLSLSGNQLTGPIPPELGQLSGLKGLKVSGNGLTGPIPPELGQFSGMLELDLSGNRLTGSIPPEAGQLSSLRRLWLHDNRLTGTIPPELGNLASLRDLALSNNQLTGPIPPVLGQLSRLVGLSLSGNQLTGPIPAELGSLSSLGVLYLWGNQLTGAIPPELGKLSSLRGLHLANNQLTGAIPPELGKLSSLVVLDLSDNQLTGPIPPELGNLSSFRWLWLTLDNNQLTGTIPPELGKLSSLRGLHLANNQLTGTIPAWLGDLSSLGSLDLDNNQLTGTIPPELGKLSSLRWLFLSNNQLRGPIPAELGNLYSLRGLDLSGNQLMGVIPQSFTNLTLEHFYFYGNPGLSVPEGPAFREWLDSIEELRDQDYSPATPFVPVILSSAGRGNAFFTSELTLTNRGSVPANLTYTYTAHIGGGSGFAFDSLEPGEQKIIPNAIEYLKDQGVPIPNSGNRIGTLRVEPTFLSSFQVGVTVRTTTAVPEGRAGLAYPAVAAEAGFDEPVYLCGLRQNAQDRSNVAFQNLGTAADGPITLRTTVFSGDPGDSRPRVLKDRTLQPGGFYQYSEVLGALDSAGGTRQGYVRVERVAGTAPFYAYGVINDQANSDGSFVFPVTASLLMSTTGQTLPVIVETGVFTSELMVTNFSDAAKTVTFRFRADAVQAPDKTAAVEWTFRPGQQMIVPNVVDMMRKLGAAGIGPAGKTFAGALFATVAEGDMSGIAIGARTAAPGGGGHYGVYYNAVPYGSAFLESAWVEALQQNEENRSNLALVNTGEVDSSPSVFQLDIYDGETGELANTVTGFRVAAGGWRQINGILDSYAPGTTQGYVRISKTSGNNPFLAYGVINDGGAPGHRSGDGAYLPAREKERRRNKPVPPRGPAGPLGRVRPPGTHPPASASAFINPLKQENGSPRPGRDGSTNSASWGQGRAVVFMRH